MSIAPQLVRQYVEFCDYRKNFKQNNTIDLQNGHYFFPSNLLLLNELIIQHPNAKYIPPRDSNLANYVSTILFNKPSSGKTYVPVVNLPPNREQSNDIIECVYRLESSDNDVFGGETAFKYLISELVDNIYQHSQFTRASITAQKYINAHHVDLCFFDNGITIPKNFLNQNLAFKPHEAIAEAINGHSTVNTDRGYGLRSSVKMNVQGLKGQIFVVSGEGGVYLDSEQQNTYICDGDYSLDGTLISLSVPYPSPSIDIYDYVE